MSARSSSGASTPVYADKAAETIQRNFRGFKDRLKVREKAAFNINQLIEYAEEQDHLNLNKFFMRWIKLIKNKSNEEVSNYVSTSIQDDLLKMSENDIKIEPNYTGPHLSENFNESDFEKLLHSFRNNEILHTRYAVMILNKAIAHLDKLHNINEISCVEQADPTSSSSNWKFNYIKSLFFVQFILMMFKSFLNYSHFQEFNFVR